MKSPTVSKLSNLFLYRVNGHIYTPYRHIYTYI
nr:MAG TPA: hypothetical protein [Caudoviricetes sp.]